MFSAVRKIKLLLRKYTLPIRGNSLVIDVGSGGNPHYRADVSTDMYDSNEQRFEDIKYRGLFVWSNAEKMPFKNKVFQYSISSHVLEHTFHPEAMIVELERISEGGYIETPPAWLEIVSPYKMHCSRVSIKNGDTLYFSIKTRYDEPLPKNFEDLYHSIKAIQQYNRPRHTIMGINAYYWRSKIKYEVYRPENYAPLQEYLEETELNKTNFIFKVKESIDRLLSIRPFRKKFTPQDILCCPKCHSDLDFTTEKATCKNNACHSEYGKHKGHWDFRI